MFAKRSFILIGVLLVALPITAAELWVAPAADPPDTEVGDWAVTAGGSTHFSFAVPADMSALSSVKVVVIGKNNKDTLVDLYLSISENEQRHDLHTDSILGVEITCVADEFMEVDVTDIFLVTPPLNPGVDYVSLYFSTKFARVVGLRFIYDANTALQSDLDAEETAREAADTALQNALDAEEAARIAGDLGLQAQINSDHDRIPFNELISDFGLDGSLLQITEAGTPHQVDLGGLVGDGVADVCEELTGDPDCDLATAIRQLDSPTRHRLDSAWLWEEGSDPVSPHKLAMIIGTDGNPLIVYSVGAEGDFSFVETKIAHCEDPACSQWTVLTLAVGPETFDLGMGSDGNPVLAPTSVPGLKHQCQA